ncbi:MAG: iron-containing alcohol dehydrogenase, partial [Planctomycetota bacterium]
MESNYTIEKKLSFQILYYNSLESLFHNLFSYDEHRVIIVDSTLYEVWKDRLGPYLQKFPFLAIQGGDRHKNWNQVILLLDFFENNKVRRQSVVIAIGGGTILDLVGFAASIYKRGISWIAVPTTLLAMIDSAIGGKTAINWEGKNLLGTFHFPRKIMIYPGFLDTLPSTEIFSGIGESIKHGFLSGSKEIITIFPKNNPLPWIQKNIETKLSFILSDPFEENKRAFLNLGHTFGHGLEFVRHYTISHGEAVVWGILLALEFGIERSITDLEFGEEAKKRIQGLGYSFVLQPGEGTKLVKTMEKDKKRERDYLNLILLHE